MPPAHETLVTLATYNEIENLPRLVDEIFAAAADVDVLVIDDNSPDGTGQWCDAKAVVEPRLHQLIRHPGAHSDRTFAIAFDGAEVEAFVFTFG